METVIFYLREPLKKIPNIAAIPIRILIHSKLIFNAYNASSKLRLSLLIYPPRFLWSISIVKKIEYFSTEAATRGIP